MSNRAVVTARFELAASSAAALEGMLRALTQHVSSTLLEVTTDVQQILPERIAALEADGERGRPDESAGLDTENLGIEDRAEPLGRGSDDGAEWSVLRQEAGHLAQSADSGLREETSGDSVIVATGELK